MRWSTVEEKRAAGKRKRLNEALRRKKMTPEECDDVIIATYWTTPRLLGFVRYRAVCVYDVMNSDCASGQSASLCTVVV
jgi:hypothetical protein